MTDETLPDDPGAYVLALQEELAGWHREWPFGDSLRLLAMVVELSLQALPAESKSNARDIKLLRHHLRAVRGKARALVWGQFMGSMVTIAAAERKQLETAREQLEAARPDTEVGA